MLDDMHGSPRIISRACGGWLALAPLSAALQIGVTGHTEEEATKSFHAAWRRCRELLAQAENGERLALEESH
jgi:hypothetical protein